MPHFAAPTPGVRDSFLEAARDLRDEGWLATFPVEKVTADFDGYVRRVRAEEEAWGVPVTTFWYIDGPLYLGTAIVRHRLTPELTRDGGHIGYHVAPRHRRQGHATAMLAAAVRYCQDGLGLQRILVTCADSNTASRRVIEAGGGVRADTIDGVCRYWIKGA